MRVDVTPCVGVWIEILEALKEFSTAVVTPCVGVWIEIDGRSEAERDYSSLPAWECGLKFLVYQDAAYRHPVTPCVGVWIEILVGAVLEKIYLWSLPAWECGLKLILQNIPCVGVHRHSLRGSVD